MTSVHSSLSNPQPEHPSPNHHPPSQNPAKTLPALLVLEHVLEVDQVVEELEAPLKRVATLKRKLSGNRSSTVP